MTFTTTTGSTSEHHHLLKNGHEYDDRSLSALSTFYNSLLAKPQIHISSLADVQQAIFL